MRSLRPVLFVGISLLLSPVLHARGGVVRPPQWLEGQIGNVSIVVVDGDVIPNVQAKERGIVTGLGGLSAVQTYEMTFEQYIPMPDKPDLLSPLEAQAARTHETFVLAGMAGFELLVFPVEADRIDSRFTATEWATGLLAALDQLSRDNRSGALRRVVVLAGRDPEIRRAFVEQFETRAYASRAIRKITALHNDFRWRRWWIDGDRALVAAMRGLSIGGKDARELLEAYAEVNPKREAARVPDVTAFAELDRVIDRAAARISVRKRGEVRSLLDDQLIERARASEQGRAAEAARRAHVSAEKARRPKGAL